MELLLRGLPMSKYLDQRLEVHSSGEVTEECEIIVVFTTIVLGNRQPLMNYPMVLAG